MVNKVRKMDDKAPSQPRLSGNPNRSPARAGSVRKRRSDEMSSTCRKRRGEGYGVRFEQEQGVSRMLTINLNDVEKELNLH